MTIVDPRSAVELASENERLRAALRKLLDWALAKAPGSTQTFDPATATSIAIICEDALNGSVEKERGSVDTEKLRKLRELATQGEWTWHRAQRAFAPVYEAAFLNGYELTGWSARADAELMATLANALPELCRKADALDELLRVNAKLLARKVST